MTHSINSKIYLLTLLFLALTRTVTAGVPDSLHYMVSPSGCHPADASSAARLKLINGVWTTKPLGAEHIADVHLVCPVNFYGSTGQFNNFQLWFKATKGSNYSAVIAEVFKRSRSQGTSTKIATITSQNETFDGNSYGFINHQVVPGGPETGNAYYVNVRLFWNKFHSPVNPAFTGMAIDIQ